MIKPMSRRKQRRERGLALPMVLVMTVSVGALSTGYMMRNLREHGRESFDRDKMSSLYDAWSGMQVATRLVNESPYDGLGRNAAMMAALARPDAQFVDGDGWPTGVTVVEQGGTGSGFFDLVSTQTVGQATTKVTALVRERQSFADFNFFVNSQPLGISGGLDANFPYSDAPEGSIHSNDKLVFYFADRHFRDAVTAVNGFDYTAGARGPGDSHGQNNWFHGPMNNHANGIAGLTDVDIPAFTTRSDCLLALTGDYDFAKVHLKGSQALVEQWTRAHAETQLVPQQVQQFHSEARTLVVPDYGYVTQPVPTNTPVYGTTTVPVYTTTTTTTLVTPATTSTTTVPVYTQQLVTAAWVETMTGTQTVYVTVTDTPAWDENVVTTTLVLTNVWVSGGGGSDTGGSGGSGGIGYWDPQWLPVTTTSVVHHAAVTHQQATPQSYTYPVNHPAVYQQVQTGTTTQTVNVPAVYSTTTTTTQTGTATKSVVVGYTVTYVNQQVYVQTGSHTVNYTVQVSDGFITQMVPTVVQVPEHKVQDFTVVANGTVFVKGDVYFVPMTVAADGYDTHVLDGSITFASDSNVYVQDSIRYGKNDPNGVLQTAYLNGADRTKPYVKNNQYKGSSVLGLVARNDIVYMSDMPTQSEINATMLAKNGEVRVEGVSVDSSATVTPVTGGWVKMSLRRLGGMTTNRRPVSTYVDSNSAVTRGFVYGKSVYDVRQRTTPPRGFPTINRPRVLATMICEVQ